MNRIRQPDEESGNPVYVFLHIPKCAGSTFRFHINKNTRPEERLNINSDKAFRKLGNAHVFHEVGWNPEYDDFLHKELDAMSAATKSRIRVIQGHGVFYGVHRHFDRPCRYLTFIRNPVNRTVSEYNYLRMLLGRPAKDDLMKAIIESRCRAADGGVLGFEQWLEQRYVPSYQMAGFLHARRFLAVSPEHATEDDIRSALEKFHFVGMTESFDEDALYFYHRLGIRRFYADQNISRPYFHPESEIIRKIEEKNPLDRCLHELAFEKNRAFKRDNMDFERVVRRVKRRRRLVVPLTSLAARCRRVVRVTGPGSRQ